MYVKTRTLVLVTILLGGLSTAHGGPYVGIGAGRGQVATGALQTAFDPYVSKSAESHSDWEAFVGYRSNPYFSAEVEYIHLGQVGPSAYPTSSSALSSADVEVNQHGYGAFALVYLPWKDIDFFAKGGVARMQSHTMVSSYAPGPCGGVFCEPSDKLSDFTNTAAAFGAGAQWRLESFALRAEYERFSAAGGHPYAVNLALAYSLYP